MEEAVALKNTVRCEVITKFVKEHLYTQQCCWENVLWTDETKVELFEKNVLHYEVQWRDHHDLELLCCFWGQKARPQSGENEIPGLSRIG